MGWKFSWKVQWDLDLASNFHIEVALIYRLISAIHFLSKCPISPSYHCCCPCCYHGAPLFTLWYWFPLKLRCEFRILPITFKVLQALTPLFLHNLVHFFVPFRNLLSVSRLSLLPHHFSSWLCQNTVLFTAEPSVVELSSSWYLQIWEINSLPLPLQDFGGLSHRVQSVVRPCDRPFIPPRPPPSPIF